MLSWWSRARRERDGLPWRTTRDPWAVLVAETMLAQTQVSRVADRYAPVLERFPDPASLAAAPLGELLRLWNGLGYNRRAVHLHEAARRIVEDHGGRVPDRLEALVALPGVGAYTARAVLAFAHAKGAAVVDTNVGRVLARAVAGQPLSSRRAQQLADGLVVGERAREWNLAVMDLGSLVCRAARPLCERCPLADRLCAWRRASGRERRPEPVPDPALGSAGTSRTPAPFAGSDRQGRGRLVRAAVSGPVPSSRLARAAGWPDDPERAARVAADLVAEGLLVRDGRGRLRLP